MEQTADGVVSSLLVLQYLFIYFFVELSLVKASCKHTQLITHEMMTIESLPNARLLLVELPPWDFPTSIPEL